MRRSTRDIAIGRVDARVGYTAEHAPDPDAHRDEYDREEGRVNDEVCDCLIPWLEGVGNHSPSCLCVRGIREEHGHA